MMRVRVCEHIAGVYRASMSVRCHELSGSTASCAKGDGMAEEKMCKQRVGRPHVPALPGEWGYFGVGSEFGVERVHCRRAPRPPRPPLKESDTWQSPVSDRNSLFVKERQGN